MNKSCYRFTLRTSLLMPALLLLLNCNRGPDKNFLGSAVVECRTYDVATTAQGRIVAINTDEGRTVAKGDLVAIIDTTPLCFQKSQLLADLGELGATIASQEAQNKSVAADVAGAEREFNRSEELYKNGSTTQQQRDMLSTQLQSAGLRLSAGRRVTSSLEQRRKSLQARLDDIDDQIRRCYVTSPANGIVLTRYRNTGEVVPPANPLYQVGDFDTLYADFFVPQTELATLGLGQPVRIRVDYDAPDVKEHSRFLPATVTWVGSEAEFSPKNIQTRQSRNELVFRIRATIPNSNGTLKRGLPVEVWR